MFVGTEATRRGRREAADRAIGETAAHINAAMARLLAELAAFIDTDGWADQGARTPEEWVGWRLGVTPGDARHHVRIAQRLRDLPLISQSFGKGELSYWQVRAIVPVATPETEADLLNMAHHSTAGQLARIARAYKSCLDRAELELSNEAHRQRSLNYYFDGDGFLEIRGRLTADEGAVLVSALRAAEDQLWDEVSDDDETRPSPDQIRADALVEVARAALAAPEAITTAKPSVVVHVDMPSLLAGAGDRCEIADGPSISSETARRLACDCVVQGLFEGDGEVRDLGRKKRVVSPRMRMALEERDKTCVFPGCARSKFLDAHHIVHWIYNGETKMLNLALLCYHHHRLMHEGGYSMQLNEADMTFTFFRPDGEVVPNTSTLGGGDPEMLIARQDRLKIDERTCTTLWDGRTINYDYCVAALLQAEGMLGVPRRGPPVALN